MIAINITKAKAIAHEIRRANRELEFAPYDEIVAKQIPGKVADAEQARERIRQRYANIQNLVDAASTIDELKEAIANRQS